MYRRGATAAYPSHNPHLAKVHVSEIHKDKNPIPASIAVNMEALDLSYQSPDPPLPLIQPFLSLFSFPYDPNLSALNLALSQRIPAPSGETHFTYI